MKDKLEEIGHEGVLGSADSKLEAQHGYETGVNPISLVPVIGFSALFGFYLESAEDLGPARGQPILRRVRFVGEVVVRERLVFPELRELDRNALKSLNAIYFAGPTIDLPDHPALTRTRPSRRRITLPKKGR